MFQKHKTLVDHNDEGHLLQQMTNNFRSLNLFKDIRDSVQETSKVRSNLLKWNKQEEQFFESLEINISFFEKEKFIC